MQIGMVGLGRIGASMVTRLLRGGHVEKSVRETPSGT